MGDMPVIDRIRAVFEQFYGPSALKTVGNEGIIWADHAPGRAMQPNDLDCLDRLEFIMAIEEEFDIEIPDDIAEICCTIAETSRHVAAILTVRDMISHPQTA